MPKKIKKKKKVSSKIQKEMKHSFVNDMKTVESKVLKKVKNSIMSGFSVDSAKTMQQFLCFIFLGKEKISKSWLSHEMFFYSIVVTAMGYLISTCFALKPKFHQDRSASWKGVFIELKEECEELIDKGLTLICNSLKFTCAWGWRITQVTVFQRVLPIFGIQYICAVFLTVFCVFYDNFLTFKWKRKTSLAEERTHWPHNTLSLVVGYTWRDAIANSLKYYGWGHNTSALLAAGLFLPFLFLMKFINKVTDIEGDIDDKIRLKASTMILKAFAWQISAALFDSLEHLLNFNQIFGHFGVWIMAFLITTLTSLIIEYIDDVILWWNQKFLAIEKNIVDQWIEIISFAVGTVAGISWAKCHGQIFSYFCNLEVASASWIQLFRHIFIIFFTSCIFLVYIPVISKGVGSLFGRKNIKKNKKN